jgi:hopene-associated glycosyltransferase HpnB
MIEIIALFVALWLYLLAARGGFWLASERDDWPELPGPKIWPAVTAVIPARDEAALIATCLRSILGQDYPGRLDAIVVDDNSHDETGSIATQAASSVGASERLTVLQGKLLPPDWAGKVWANKQGIDLALGRAQPAKYFLLADADTTYTPEVLRQLVARAESGSILLTSVMPKQHCESLAERCLIPAFTFFFQMRYPFAWVNRRDRTTAAAVGGCILVRADALAASGGMEAIRGEIIDDCALARRHKPLGPIWLGLSNRVHSIRPYDSVGPIRRMVARYAYAELGFSPLRLVAAIAGMAATFLAAPLVAVFASGAASWLGLAAWCAIAIAFQPTLRLYGRTPFWGMALPLIALTYLVWTIESAVQYTRGRGGAWKGRVHAAPRGTR